MTTAGYLIPTSEEHRLTEFFRSQKHLIQSGVTDEATHVRNISAFLDTLKTYTTTPPQSKTGYYIHYKASDKRSLEFNGDFTTYDAAENALRHAYPSHSANRWKRLYDIRPISGEQAYQDFLNKPITDHQPLIPDFKPNPRYEIRYAATNKRSVSFPDQYVSRPEALRARYDAWRTTADGYVTIGEWVNSYPIHEVAQ